ncbi:carbon-nitrogen hydrolase [Achaetomium macrosporum]|uniref:Carbon-nitrogen hydrolase n=1 Tax=Achaetomium macrosporum TaxID=79813 RepID=A0AAN7CEU0_9PEZI|nr:carbon-nitrogen hydrolase [Achaetomium macrosporum]
MITKQTRFKVAAAHAAPVFMNKVEALKKVVSLIEQAGAEDIKLFVFPETFISGYPQVGALAKYAEESVVVEPNNEDMAAVQDVCRCAGVAISLGISERMAGGHTLFNSQVTIDSDGTILGVHRKLQPTYVERLVWAQGGDATLRTFPLSSLGGRNLGGQHIHAGAWPALSTMAGFEEIADAQIEGLMKAHALTAQVFVITASNYVDEGCLSWMKENLGEQEFVKAGGGWSSVLHPFCAYLAGPHTGAEEKLVAAEVDFSQLGHVKVWIDVAGHYQRPEILQFSFYTRPLWADEKVKKFGRRELVEEGTQDDEEGDKAC